MHSVIMNVVGLTYLLESIASCLPPYGQIVFHVDVHFYHLEYHLTIILEVGLYVIVFIV